MEKLEEMPNIGKAIALQLQQVGVNTPAKLKKIGAKEAWLMVQEIDQSACRHRLYTLQGAVLGIKKTALDIEIKKDLNNLYQEHKL